ncbi:MAG: flagellar biosynthesis protein FlhF [Planctomycetota bacterium]|jgi:flagellar biosynthesis protein FlhF
MLLKRINGRSLQEALSKVEKECGKNALLIETLETSRGVTIIAGRQDRALAKAKRQNSESDTRTGKWTRGFAELAKTAASAGLSSTVLRAIENALIGTGVHLDKPGDPAVAGISARILKSLIRTESLDDPAYRVTAFVGATGVGKTTTLAKIAARAVKDHGETAAIITTDTYRIAAVEQLRAFAEMLCVPFEVAFTPMDLRRAIQRHSDADRIFIDTSGHGPFDEEALYRLRGTLHSSDPAIVLCMAASSRRRDAAAIFQSYSTMTIDSAIITKWDETTAPGEALSLMIEQGMPLTQITNGQRVPEDILPACSAELAEHMFSLTNEADKEPQ